MPKGCYSSFRLAITMTGCSLYRCFTSPVAGIMRRWFIAWSRMTVHDKQPLEQMLAGSTHASLVPTRLWRLLVNRSSVSLKAVLLGGAAIPVELTEQAREQGIRCFCGYGLTEFASTVCAKEADGLADVGSPLPGREVEDDLMKCELAARLWQKVTGVTGNWFHWLMTKAGTLRAIAVRCIMAS